MKIPLDSLKKMINSFVALFTLALIYRRCHPPHPGSATVPGTRSNIPTDAFCLQGSSRRPCRPARRRVVYAAGDLTTLPPPSPSSQYLPPPACWGAAYRCCHSSRCFLSSPSAPLYLWPPEEQPKGRRSLSTPLACTVFQRLPGRHFAGKVAPLRNIPAGLSTKAHFIPLLRLHGKRDVYRKDYYNF